ncbi:MULTISPECIES: hypothetical protein [unclassified Saccharicrinis]
MAESGPLCKSPREIHGPYAEGEVIVLEMSYPGQAIDLHYIR